MRLPITAGLFLAASITALAQQPAPGAQPQPQQGNTAQPSPREQTLTGCLTSADNIFTLTIVDDSGAPGTTVENISYTLAPGSGVDLRAHLNKRVTVKGTDAGQDAATSKRIVVDSPSAGTATGAAGQRASDAGNTTDRSTGTSGTGSADAGGATPKVETEAKARITQRTFNVTNVQPAAGSCGA
ncbi:MAG: hypothetical protein AB7H96_00630 [Vicinamibacterales bacterium]